MTPLDHHGMDNVLSSTDALPFVEADSAPLDQTSFLNLGAYVADSSALRRSSNRLFYRQDVEPSLVASFASQHIRYPVVEPFRQLGIFNTDHSRFAPVTWPRADTLNGLDSAQKEPCVTSLQTIRTPRCGGCSAPSADG
jgi:hypothetical protein